MVYLDTHVVAWLYAGRIARLSNFAKRNIERETLRFAPIVQLELEYLFEIGRVRERSNVVVATLGERIGLIPCDRDPAKVTARACDLAWSRDVFDRMIVAQASLGADTLLSADRLILDHYARARW